MFPISIFTHYADDPPETRAEMLRVIAKRRHELLEVFRTVERATAGFTKPQEEVGR